MSKPTLPQHVYRCLGPHDLNGCGKVIGPSEAMLIYRSPEAGKGWHHATRQPLCYDCAVQLHESPDGMRVAFLPISVLQDW